MIMFKVYKKKKNKFTVFSINSCLPSKLVERAVDTFGFKI